MVIYIFTEHYPSPFKPYFDCQFEQFLREGHTLRIFAFGRQGGPAEPKVVALGLDRLTRYLPSTLRNVGPFAGPLLANAAGHPLVVPPALMRVARHADGAKAAVLDVVRAGLLPPSPPDLCLVHSLWTATRVTFLRRLYPGVPVAFYYHGGEVAGVPVIPAPAARRAFDAVDIVFTNTENSKAHAVGRGCAPDKIVVSPVGFSIPEFVPPEPRTYRRDGVVNLLSIGRFSQEKGFGYALEAVRLLVEQGITGFKYRLVGGGPLEGELRAFVARHGLESRVEFLGQVTREALYAELRAADVLVLPSVVWGTWQENQACVLQEAMLMKTPAIATRTGGVPESIAPELQPFSVAAEDAAALARSLAAVMALDETALAELGRQCRRFAEEKYDIVRLNRQILDGALAVASRR